MNFRASGREEFSVTGDSCPYVPCNFMKNAPPNDPVRLLRYDPLWPGNFEAEKLRLLGQLPSAEIEHIGSTAIPGLIAKPVIDLLVGVSSGTCFADTAAALKKLGYVQEGARAGHSWLTYPSPQYRKFILHLVIFGQGEWKRRLAFRDRLRRDRDKALEYQALKIKLAEKFSEDLGEYTKAKSAFVAGVAAAEG